MFSVVAAFALAASVSQVVATPINHVARGYRQDADILEDYTPYHVRYLALNCHGKHNTEFFEQCCHPLLRWQKLEDRPAQCIPSASASSSAVLAEPTAPIVDEDPIYDDDDCDDDASSPAPAAATTSYVAPEPTTYAAATTTKEAAPETTSSAKAKAAQTSEKPQTSEEPKTTSYKPEPTSSAEPKPTTAAPAPSGGNEGAFTGGFATWFLQNGVAGACGKVHGEYDLVVAADYRRYGDLGKQSDLCGKTVVITNTKNGKTVNAVVADACPTCNNDNSLDLSKGAFEKIASLDDGMVPISWYIQ